MTKTRKFIPYLFYGVLFVAVQTFWVSVVWGKDREGYLLEVGIVDVTFVCGTFLIGLLLSTFRYYELMVYLIAGIAGLIIIEWLIAKHFPGTTDANQFVMFTTWAGTAAFAMMQADKGENVKTIRRVTLYLFLSFAFTITMLGLLIMQSNAKLAFAITYIAANYGYPLFVPLFLIYFYRKSVWRSGELR